MSNENYEKIKFENENDGCITFCPYHVNPIYVGSTWCREKCDYFYGISKTTGGSNFVLCLFRRGLHNKSKKTQTQHDTIKNPPETKHKPEYIPWKAIKIVSELLTYGAENHDPYGWKCEPIEDIENAMARHFINYMAGKEKDESGFDHIVCIATRVLMLIDRKIKLLGDKNDKSC